MRAALAGVHGAFFVALPLLGLCQVLPAWQGLGGMLPPAELAVFATKNAALLGFLASGFVLAMPAAFRPHARSPAVLAVCAAILAVAGARLLTVAAIRRPIEDATLALSPMFCEMTGMPPPQLSVAGADPVMAAGGLATIIRPISSGYQGVFCAAPILGGYVVPEWRALRLGEAAAVVLAAMVTVFVPNAARIAVGRLTGSGRNRRSSRPAPRRSRQLP